MNANDNEFARGYIMYLFGARKLKRMAKMCLATSASHGSREAALMTARITLVDREPKAFSHAITYYDQACKGNLAAAHWELAALLPHCVSPMPGQIEDELWLTHITQAAQLGQPDAILLLANIAKKKGRYTEAIHWHLLSILYGRGHKADLAIQSCIRAGIRSSLTDFVLPEVVPEEYTIFSHNAISAYVDVLTGAIPVTVGIDLLQESYDAGYKLSAIAMLSIMAKKHGSKKPPSFYEEMLRLLSPVTNSQAACCQRLCAEINQKGLAGEADPAAAHDLYKKAAELGDPESLAWLGRDLLKFDNRAASVYLAKAHLMGVQGLAPIMRGLNKDMNSFLTSLMRS